MKPFNIIYILIFLLGSCTKGLYVIDSDVDSYEFRDTTLVSINEEERQNLVIKQGYLSQTSDTFRVVRDNKTIAVIRISEPMIVSQATSVEKWGFFQFPKIYRNEYGDVVVSWQMAADSPSAYGKDNPGMMKSSDEGKSWNDIDYEWFQKGQYRVEYENGDILQVNTPTTKKVKDYTSFPHPVNKEKIAGYDFYFESEVPHDLRGVCFMRWNSRLRESSVSYANLDDPGLLRYAINDEMPIVWWGDIKPIGSFLIAGVYGGYYLNSKGEVLKGGVTFYKSNKKGEDWSVIGKISYESEDKSNQLFDGSDGFTEPTFEILNNGDFICVMRSGSETPMYKCYSNDQGVTWTKPEPFTANGVKPHLLLLDNNVLVLTSGRPGVQLRFSIDGDGKLWTVPIEMVTFMDDKGNYSLWGSSCGYTSMMPYDDHTFYLVYSDFNTTDKSGQNRKSIVFRRIEVIKSK